MNTLLIIVIVLIVFFALLGFKRGLFPSWMVRFPVISGINRILGLLMGILETFLLVWIFFAVIYHNQSTGFAENMMPMIEKSAFLSFLYHHNLIILFLSLFF